MAKKIRRTKKSNQKALPGFFPEYLGTIASELESHYLFIEEISKGANGVTYKLSDHERTNYYCLKTISPDVQDKAERQRIKDTLQKEVDILRPLSHKCLPKIYKSKIESDLPFYICTYHPGKTFIDFKRSGYRFTREEAVWIITSLIDALEYMHKSGRTHCDLHQKNILISKEVFAEGILIIDFGSGHRESDSSPDTPNRGHWAYKGVNGLRHYKEDVDRQEAAPEFRRNDIKAFGSALALMVDTFFGNAPVDQILAYKDFCSVLQSGRLFDWKEVKEKFDFVIDPRSLFTSTDRLFIRKTGKRESITLPASTEVPVGEAILSVINTKVFQRLRYTKQLSFCDWYFPGGTHTRFEHSLGVFDVTYKAIGKLVHDQCFRDQFNQKNINGALLAALIHDIGHYPFAHVIEHYIASRFPEDKILKESVHHYYNTLSIINNDDELKSIVDKEWGKDILIEVKKILSGSIPVLSDLLDGPIDCDKLDYLRRDSHHTGVGYAEGINVGNVVASYCCVKDGNELGILRSGVTAVEGFMVVQDQMLSAVYWHETIRSVMAMFHRFLDVMVGKEPNKLITFANELKSCLSDHEAIYKVVIPWLEKWQSHKNKKTNVTRKEIAPLVNLHIEPSFNDIYICVATYTNLDKVPSKRSHLYSIYDTIKTDQKTGTSALPIRWKAVRTLRTCFQKAFAQNKGESIGRFDVVVDVPWGKTSGRMVFIRGEGGKQDYMITEVSHLKETIFDQQMAYNAPIRIFISPALFEKHKNHLKGIVTTAEEMFYEEEPMDEGD